MKLEFVVAWSLVLKYAMNWKLYLKKPTDKGPLQNSNILLKSVQKTNETTPKIVTYFLSVGGTFLSIFMNNFHHAPHYKLLAATLRCQAKQFLSVVYLSQKFQEKAWLLLWTSEIKRKVSN